MIDRQNVFDQPVRNYLITCNNIQITSFEVNEHEILKIIRAFKIHKAHDHDDTSIRIIKICHKSLLKPLIFLFQNSAKISYYPNTWKWSNIIPVHKKIINN